MSRLRNSRPASTVALTIVAVAAAIAGCGDTPSDPPIAGLVVVQGAPASGVPGWPLLDTLKVRVVDEAGQPRAGQPVSWAVTAGGGTVSPVNPQSDGSGLAMAVWTLGPLPAQNTVTASATVGSPAVISTTGEAFRVDQLAASAFLGCGLVSGAVWCWGKDAWVSTAPVSQRPSPQGPAGYASGAPGRVVGPGGLTAIAASGPSVCALNAGGEALCASRWAETLTTVAGLPPLRQIAGSAWGWARYCGLAVADSTAWCWSYAEVPSQPAAVPGSPALAQLSLNGDVGGPYVGFLACGLLADSSAVCWGSGSLGDGTTGGSATPVSVSGGHRFVEVATGELFACGRKVNGEVWCWGVNSKGQLGVPGPDASQPILSSTGVGRIGASQSIVLAQKNGTTRWGMPTVVTQGLVPSLAGLDVAVFGGRAIECVALADKQVYCYDEMWDQTSNWAVEDYAPVHPVNGMP